MNVSTPYASVSYGLLTRCLAAAVIVAAGVAHEARAANGTWTGATDANWNVVTNWSTTSGSSPGIVYTANATNTTDVATFNSNPTNGTTNPVLIEVNRMIGRIVFDTATAGSFNIGPVSGTTVFTFGNNLTILNVTSSVTNPQTINYPVALHLPSSTNGAATISNDATSTNAALILAGGIINSPNSTRGTAWTLGGSNTGENTISGNISGTSTGGINTSFTKTGAGTWVLSGSNKVVAAGGFTINGGVLAAANAYALGDSATANTTATNINSGGTLEIRNGITLNNGDSLNLNTGGTIRATGTAATNGRINVGTAASTSVTVATVNASDVFTIGNGTNDMTGGAADSVVAISGPGTVFQNVASDYAGGWSVNAGTLKLGSATALGGTTSAFVTFGASSTGNLQVNGNSATIAGLTSNATVGSPILQNGASGAATLTVNNASSGTYAGTIQNGGAGSLALTKGGAGTLTLRGANTYTGSTLVNAGLLAVNGTNSGGGAVTVNNGGALGGTGSVASVVTIASGGTVAPGAGVGTLTLGSLTLSAGSGLAFEFNSTPANDKIIVSTSGGLVINGGAFSFLSEGTQNAWGTNGTYNLISYGGAIGGSGIGSLSTANAAPGKQYTFGTSAGWVTLTIADSGVIASWNVDADGLWTTAGNWTPSAPNGASDAATFGSVITAPRTVTLDADRTIGGMTFDNANAYTLAAATTQTLTMGDGVGTKVVQVLSGSHTISAPIVMASAMQADVVSGQKLTLSGVISGTAALSKTQAGTLVLGASNSYTGSTNLNAGTTEFVSGGLGAGVAVNIGGGASLKYAAGNTQDISTKTVTIGVGGATIDTNGNDVTLASSIGNAGAGALTKSGAGTLTLGGSNTYTGGTVINTGTASINNANSLGDAAGVATINDATLRSTATISMSRNVTIGHTNSTIAVDPGTSLTLSGLVSGTGVLNKAGAGTLLLSGSNSFASSVLAGGTVSLGGVANTGIGTGAVTFNGGVLSSNAAGGSDPGGGGYGFVNNFVVPAGQTGTLNLPFRGNNSGSLTGSGTFNVNVHGARDDFAGNWSAFTGQINVGTMTGSGDFRLNTTSGFGTSAVNLGSGVNMYVSTNFATNPTSFTIGELSGAASSTLAGQNATNSGRTAIFSVGGRNTDATFAGTIRDGSVSSVGQPTAITKVGTGAWTLTGTSTYTGATTVSAGSLLIDGLLGNTAVTVGSAGLLGGRGTLAGAVAVSGTLSPGNTLGLITLGSLTLNPSSTTLIEVVSAGTRGVDYDAIDITGLSGLAYGGTMAIAFGGSALPDNTVLTVFGFTGTPSSSFAGVSSTGYYSGAWTSLGAGTWQVTSGIQTATFSEAAGTITIVPEPTSCIALLASVGLGALVVRRRQAASN